MSGTNAQLMTQLRQGEIDVVLGRLAQASAMADLAFEQLFSEPLLLVVRPGHPLASRRKPTLDALAAHRWCCRCRARSSGTRPMPS